VLEDDVSSALALMNDALFKTIAKDKPLKDGGKGKGGEDGDGDGDGGDGDEQEQDGDEAEVLPPSASKRATPTKRATSSPAAGAASSEGDKENRASAKKRRAAKGGASGSADAADETDEMAGEGADASDEPLPLPPGVGIQDEEEPVPLNELPPGFVDRVLTALGQLVARDKESTYSIAQVFETLVMVHEMEGMAEPRMGQLLVRSPRAQSECCPRMLPPRAPLTTRAAARLPSSPLRLRRACPRSHARRTQGAMADEKLKAAAMYDEGKVYMLG
jgi:hypothetical protein